MKLIRLLSLSVSTLLLCGCGNTQPVSTSEAAKSTSQIASTSEQGLSTQTKTVTITSETPIEPGYKYREQPYDLTNEYLAIDLGDHGNVIENAFTYDEETHLESYTSQKVFGDMGGFRFGSQKDQGILTLNFDWNICHIGMMAGIYAKEYSGSMHPDSNVSFVINEYESEVLTCDESTNFKQYFDFDIDESNTLAISNKNIGSRLLIFSMTITFIIPD